jgi:hypothetical protein
MTDYIMLLAQKFLFRITGKLDEDRVTVGYFSGAICFGNDKVIIPHGYFFLRGYDFLLHNQSLVKLNIQDFLGPVSQNRMQPTSRLTKIMLIKDSAFLTVLGVFIRGSALNKVTIQRSLDEA